MAEIQFNGTEWEVSDALQAFYTPYASYVIQTRALPDARDGLKTGARFILFSQYKDKLTCKQKRRKAVATVNAATRFSPHGDASVLGTAIRLSQDFSMRYPVIEVQGNNGSYLSGDDYSQPRYLEMRGNEIAWEMTHLLDKETIDEWRLNYLQEEEYPSVLPSKFPFSLVNGNFGIGVACSSSTPPHNLHDVVAAAIKLIKNPKASFEDIYCPIDFPTGGIIINESEVKESLANGNGKAAIVRANINYDAKEKELIVTEMPYMTFTTNTIKSISKALEDGKLEGIESVYDGTDYEGCKIFIKLEKGANPEKVKKYLYKYTSLQNSYSINQNMLENGKVPKLFTWKQMIEAYLSHLRDIIIKAYEFDLRKLKKRLNIVEGLLICTARIEEVIQTIKSSTSTADAKNNLMKKFLLNEEQADAVLEMKLAKLAHLEVEKLEKEKATLVADIAKIEAILSSDEKIKQEMINDLTEMGKKYGDSRRTVNMDIMKEDDDEDLPEPEDIIITISNQNSIKRTSASNIKVQKRNGKGSKQNEETPIVTISSNTVDMLYLFTDKGRMYSLLAGNLEDDNTFYHFSKYLPLKDNEMIVAATSKKRENADKYVVFFTKNGYIKKSLVEEYQQTKRRTGTQAIKLEDGDEIRNVIFANDEDEAIIITKDGMSIRFSLDEVSPIGKVARGVIGIKLLDGDEIATGIIVEGGKDLLLINNNSMAKRVSLSEFTLQKRGGKGLLVMGKNLRGNSSVIDAFFVNDKTKLILNGANSKSICLSVTDIPIASRISQGVLTMKDTKIVSAEITE